MRVSTAALVATFLVATRSHAFCRETTIAPAPTFMATASKPCWDQGLPVFWKNACISYSVQKDASQQVTLADAEQIMATAFAQWTGATCGVGAPSISVQFLGEVACHERQYLSTGGNANILMFDDTTWPYPTSGGGDTIALTTTTYNIDTGELYDADIEVNTAPPSQVSVGDGGSAPDLLAALTHEAGHFLGLAHSIDTTATMFGVYQGLPMRTLAQDDVDGLCTVYPPGGVRPTADGGVPADSCDPTPRHGYATECDSPGTGGGCGCKVAAAQQSPWFAVAPLLLLARRKRKRGREFKIDRAAARAWEESFKTDRAAARG